MDPITHQSFAQLDLALVPQEWLTSVIDVASDRSTAMSTDHFPVLVDVEIKNT